MAQDPKQTDSVYDFLYVDLPRLGLLLSQFGEDGVLTELSRQTDDASESGGAIGPKFAQLSSKDAARRGLTRKFDPRWMVPLNFLDVVQDVLQRDFSAATLGQLVIVEGYIGVVDVGMLRSFWDEPLVRRLIASGIPEENLQEAGVSRQDRRRQGGGKSSAGSTASDLQGFVGSIMKMLPHAVHATIYTNDGQQLWGTLTQESIIGSSSDLLLKHGTALAGRWHMIGILDALPAEQEDAIQQLIRQVQGANMLGQILGNIRPVLENGFSRPAAAFGVTPLIIMRSIDVGLGSEAKQLS